MILCGLIFLTMTRSSGTAENLVRIVVGNGDEMEVQRKLSGLDNETWMLVEMFGMADGDKLPGVEVVWYGGYKVLKMCSNT